MPYVNVNDAYILDNTGKQVDDAVDYALANSNRNLLDNPWFTVNQRGYTSNNLLQLQYWADRWLRNTSTNGQGSLSLSNGVVTLTAPSGGGAFGNILQRMADPSIINGKTITLSLLKSDGTIISGSFVRTMGTAQTAYNSNNIKLQISASNAVVVQVENGASISFKAVKLELGSYSTLANDVPPDYGEELRKCQRYFIRLKNSGWTILGSGYASSATNLRVLIPLPVTMRATPTRSYSGSFEVIGNGSNALSVTNMTAGFVTANGLEIGVTTSGMTLYQTYHLVSQDTTAYIDFSADL